MKLSLIGHASVLVEAGPVRLISDPWLVGRAFNDGWAIHPQPAWQPGDLADATHLWISHEHPDHLSIPTLRSIPAEVRAQLTVLFQRTWSGTVADYLATLGFADVIELEHRHIAALAPDVQVFCWQVGHQDSALAIRHGGRTVLNLNDCKPSRAGLGRLRAATGPIDVLLDQFSIAGWAGNPGDHDRLEAAKQGAVETLLAHVDLLEPAATVPFASFMRFCHQENVHLNRAVVSLRDLARRWEVDGSGALVLLHHGDGWAIGDPAPAADTALATDQACVAERDSEPLVASDSTSLEAVESALAQ